MDTMNFRTLYLGSEQRLNRQAFHPDRQTAVDYATEYMKPLKTGCVVVQERDWTTVDTVLPPPIPEVKPEPKTDVK